MFDLSAVTASRRIFPALRLLRRLQLAQLAQNRQKLGTGRLKAQRQRHKHPLGSDHQIHIGGDHRLMQPEKFAQYTLDPVAYHRVARFAGNGKANPPILVQPATQTGKDHELPGKKTTPCVITQGEVRSSQQPVPPGSG